MHPPGVEKEKHLLFVFFSPFLCVHFSASLFLLSFTVYGSLSLLSFTHPPNFYYSVGKQ